MFGKIYHPSWLIAWFFAAAISGIAICGLWQVRFYGLSWVITIIFLSAAALIKRNILAIVLVIISGLLLGLVRGSASQTQLNSYQPLIGTGQTISGSVSEDVSISEDGDISLKIKDVEINGRNYPGHIWISSSQKTDIKRSDRVKIYGKLSAGFGSFPAAVFKADVIQVDRVRNIDPARDIRDRFAAAVRQLIKEPEASLGIGYLTGQRSALPEYLNEQLRILGLTHIVVASGYNLSILVRFSRRLVARFSKYLSVAVGLILTAGFILVTGLSPSMTRAGLITSISLLAWYFGRNLHPLVLLPTAAGITAVVNPSYVWGDLGWYLSFSAFAGVIVLAPLVGQYFFGKKRNNSILQILVETSSAQLMTFPIIAYAFGQYAPLALLANLAILPLIPWAMALTFVAGAGGLMSLPFWLGVPAEVILRYMTAVVERLAQMPSAVAEINFTVLSIIGFYVAVVLLVFYLHRKTRFNFSEYNIVE